MIYVVRDEATGLVKLGYSNSPYHRISKIRSDCPGELSIIAVTEGDRATESELHDRFSHLHVRGEWHRYEGDLERWAASIPHLVKPIGERPAEVVLAERLSAATGVGYITARSWVRRGGIPGRYWKAIDAAGVMTLVELADAAANRRDEAA